MVKVNKKEPKFKFFLGDEVSDTITGYKGIVVCRSQWIYNCNTYGVRSTELKDGLPMDDKFFDEPQLKLIKKEVKKPSNKTGGPTSVIPQTNR